MPVVALAVLALYLALAFGWRSWIQWRRTGSTGFRGFSRGDGWAALVGGVLFAGALVLAALAPLAELAGLVRPWPPLTGTGARLAGLGLCAAGLAGTLWSQLVMGDSWRIGVDARERTTLVASGPFRLVRNPIFTSMVGGVAGLALLTPNALAAAAVVLLVVGLELHVRRVEEPYLLRTHGDAYRAYAARAGRFVPGIGRLARAAAPRAPS
jgi:protein-S-isoprenylcysteine O-methyltransferase Ste14